MPGEIDGFGLATWVRANRPGLPIILTSADGKKSEAAKDLCENEPLFAKPYDVQLVVADSDIDQGQQQEGQRQLKARSIVRRLSEMLHRPAHGDHSMPGPFDTAWESDRTDDDCQSGTAWRGHGHRPTSTARPLRPSDLADNHGRDRGANAWKAGRRAIELTDTAARPTVLPVILSGLTPAL
jgi:hypothetical protein